MIYCLFVMFCKAVFVCEQLFPPWIHKNMRADVLNPVYFPLLINANVCATFPDPPVQKEVTDTGIDKGMFEYFRLYTISTH